VGFSSHQGQDFSVLHSFHTSSGVYPVGTRECFPWSLPSMGSLFTANTEGGVNLMQNPMKICLFVGSVIAIGHDIINQHSL
jgi:hypothetical protein